MPMFPIAGVPNKVLSSFSLRKNVKELCEVRGGGEMDNLHGLRVISMFWVVLGHAYENAEITPNLNNLDLLQVKNR